uniref:Flavin-dependent thymidylate synthase n=1 Tax=Thermodesulfobium narugense TaxID=184064 RepID=A0A7C5PM88_9BACT
MKVSLIFHTPDPVRAIALGARVSVSNKLISDIYSELKEDEAIELVKRLYKMGHHTPFEHVSFTFGIENISRSCSHQLVRHRIASFTQKSQRYTRFGTRSLGSSSDKRIEIEDLYVFPPSFQKHPSILTKYRDYLELGRRLYEDLLSKGIPAEDARYILPNSAHTSLVMTMNFRELMHASSLRLCQRAQWEIRSVFEEIKKRVFEVSPFLSEFLCPKCEITGYCNEEKSCGRKPKKES